MDVQQQRAWQVRLHQIIYESDTTAGKLFDVALLVLIFRRLPLMATPRNCISERKCVSLKMRKTRSSRSERTTSNDCAPT